MAIPKITKQNVFAALKMIDKEGVPDHHTSYRYNLVTENGNKYPPKYVIAMADHLANGVEINTGTYNAVDAKNFLVKMGFQIEEKQQRFELRITAEKILSTDERFSVKNLSDGDNYKPLDVYYQKSDGVIIRRKYEKGEQKCSNQTLPRLCFQIFESQIAGLSIGEKEQFPVCQYTLTSEIIRGIFPSVDEFKKHRNTLEYCQYSYDGGRKFVLYCWNIFSTLTFVQECLKRFGDAGDCFILVYREKNEDEKKDKKIKDKGIINDQNPPASGYRNPYSKILLESKNIIFRGAPGTGKSYLAKEIAADIVSDGYYDDYTQLSDEQKKQIEFVQFHPSYDYSDFVEGLRPKVNEDGSMGFELQSGIFKKFVDRARRNYENAQKTKEEIAKEASAQETMEEFFSEVNMGSDSFKTINGNEFFITDVDDEHIHISIPGNASIKSLNLSISELRRMLESGKSFEKIKDITHFFGKTFATQGYSYDFALYKEICAKKKKNSKKPTKVEELKKYIFIIDEINRGEISKIFGELFFAIDPGYRGKAGEVSTQYSNLHSDPDEKFYIPENVYIIGTMNDIDRSVDSFDFAMRRRFRFIQLRADERLEMLALLKNEDLKNEAIDRLTKLNQAIVREEELNENYQIGASYFLKLRYLTFDQLWTDHLEPLLQEYVHGMYDEKGIMKKFAQAYGYVKPSEGNENGSVQN